MNLCANAVRGIAPLELVFSVTEQGVIKLVKWLWNFGDGSFSTEKEPKHTYTAPGIYTVGLTVVDEYGNIYSIIKVNYIYVYDYVIGDNGLISGYTDFCFKHAVKPNQGQGIVPYGSLWIWPMILSATAKGYNSQHENLSLVVNSEDMRIYRIGIPELWLDREGSYEEAEIPTEAKFPEIVSRYGEHENVRHVETHVSMQAFDELRYRGKGGYTSDGFRNAQQLRIEIYKGGEQIVPTTVLRQVVRDGDFAFLKEVEARRMQIKLMTTTSAYRITRAEVHAQELDHRTPPQFNDIPEKRWQREFGGGDIWFSRNKPSIQTNRADAVAWAGAGVPITGPDSKQSAFTSAAGLLGTVEYAVSDFTVSAWLMGEGTIMLGQVQGGGVFIIEYNADKFRFGDGVELIEYDVTPVSLWQLFTVIRRGLNIELYVNGKLKYLQTFTAVRAYGGNVVVGALATIFDIRRKTIAVSAEALNYYYDMVLEGGGGFLP